jgi:hypothetical protein
MRKLWKYAIGIAGGALLLTGCLGPGSYPVSPTLQNGHASVGLWHTVGGDGCFWARRDAVGHTIANDIGNGPRYVDIQPTDAYFETTGCQAWVQADGALDHKYGLTAQGQLQGDGQWRVGAEIPAGTYQATQPLTCYWARLNSFRGTDDTTAPTSIIQNDFSGAVTIDPSDVGFESSNCGIWTKTG